MVSPFFFLYVVLLMCSSHNLFCSAATDTLSYGDQVIDDGSKSIVSSGEVFELGFFSPTPKEEGSPGADRRYVGIWYHKLTTKTVVWVANRDDPIPANSTGVLTIEEGNLCLFDDVTRKKYWSTMIVNSLSTNTIVKIMDSGNLVLGNITDGLAASPMWQSFQTPTDTFIPGMMMGDNLELTSWKEEDDPGTGNFTFKGYQGASQQFMISKKSTTYWKSGEPGKYFSSDDMTPEVTYLLSNFSKTTVTNLAYPSNFSTVAPRWNYNYTRLVMSYTGELRALRWTEDKKQWLPFWSEPDDGCSVFNPCGNSGSCNNNNWPFGCKCLPGFRPQFPEKWNFGDFSGGCSRESEISGNETFLSLKMLRVGEEDSNFIVKNETECRKECLDNFECQAYSYEPPQDSTRRDNPNTSSCLTWSTLNNLIEDYGNIGHILSVRVASSDIESTERDCKPCGTTLIPYPLSTGLDCGDPMYSDFNCNNSTGEVSFKGHDGNNFTVVRINTTTQRFVIQIQTKNADNCDALSRDNNQQLNPTPPFKITNWCYVDDVLRRFSSQVSSRVSNVELGWKLPLEPICNTTEDCRGWPNSICSRAEDGERRCKCSTSYRWNGQTLNCTGENMLQEPVNTELMPPRRKDPLVWILVAVLTSVICLLCISFIYIRRKKMNKRRDQINRARLDSERQIKELIDTSELDEEDEKGLDVPFFDLQSILEATDNFSDANKLGQGGYGPVYKGKFAGGQEVAVKRLSRVSGQGLQEFKNEVVLIAKLQHRNLVRLRGYCLKGEEKILLYEYMPNKSLESFIFDHAQSALLNWEMRFNIILGIARGLLYLHQDSRLRIIHRDLKTSNILLDEEMNPKISDFGLARIVGGKETEANTATVVGTYGYMSPEYALDGTFSVKSDVFSFGVVLLEIISGKKNTGFYQSKQTFSLLGYAWELWTENKVLDLMDKTLDESCNQNEFIKCVNVGLLCVQEDPIDRPTMSNVITLLDSEAAIPPIPKQPAFLIRRGNSSTASSSTKPETNSEITMTLEGR